MSHYNTKELLRMSVEYEDNCKSLGGTSEECNDDVWSEPGSNLPVNFVVVNGLFQPTLSLAANRWYRWRMVLATVFAVLEMTITGCEMKLLAKDGVYLTTAPRDIAKAFMGPGNRADWLVRCPQGTFELVGEHTLGADPFVQKIAIIEATDQGDANCDMPVFNINRPVSVDR